MSRTCKLAEAERIEEEASEEADGRGSSRYKRIEAAEGKKGKAFRQRKKKKTKRTRRLKS